MARAANTAELDPDLAANLTAELQNTQKELQEIWKKTYLTYLKEGAFYALLFMGLFLLVDFITDYQGTSTFFS